MTFLPKKKFGQNFLVNPNMQAKVISKMQELGLGYAKYKLVEVGPGKGDLTKHILDFGRGLTAFEIDPEAVELLQGEFAENKNFEIFEKDFLEVLEQGGLSEEFVLLSNLPFNVGSRLLVDLAVYYPQTPFCVILQKEVAKKINKNNDFTFFGAWLNLFWEVKYGFDISPNNFKPSPKVYSGLIVGKPRQESLANKDQQTRKEAKEILKKLFANPKKTLANNLKNLDWETDKIKKFYEDNNLDKNLRLKWDNYEEVLELVLSVE